jgi:hypothetical protein
MTVRLLPISIGLTTCAFALGYTLGGLWNWTPFIIALGLLWLLGRWRGWDWMASAELVLFAGVAAGGPCQEWAAGCMLFGMGAALAAWDLDYFAQRLRSVEYTPRAHDLERRHLGRLLVVEGLGLLLGAVALGVKVRFSFATACLLGLVAVLGLSQAVGFLRHESD